MPVHLLQIGSKAVRKVNKVVRFAKKKENWYDPSVPGWMSKIPGHNRRHQCQINDFRCVFSWTVDRPNNRVVRHLSVSAQSEGYPTPGIIQAIAYLFGFKGRESTEADFPEDWAIRIKENGPIDDHCIVIGQDTGLRP